MLHINSKYQTTLVLYMYILVLLHLNSYRKDVKAFSNISCLRVGRLPSHHSIPNPLPLPHTHFLIPNSSKVLNHLILGESLTKDQQAVLRLLLGLLLGEGGFAEAETVKIVGCLFGVLIRSENEHVKLFLISF